MPKVVTHHFRYEKFVTYKSKNDTKRVQNIKSQKRTRHTVIDKVEYICS